MPKIKRGTRAVGSRQPTESTYKIYTDFYLLLYYNNNTSSWPVVIYHVNVRWYIPALKRNDDIV